METKVKICGIRHFQSAQAAIDAGADFLGFNFVNFSKRFINPMKAKLIIDALGKKIPVVGVFQNASIDEVNEHIRYLKLPFVQLHGDEDDTYMKKIHADVVKTITISDLKNNELSGNKKIRFYLLDRNVQGQGEMVDANQAKLLAEQVPVFLAGGLDHTNVAEIIKNVKPFAVDVAGGIETDGMEDLEKIKKFIMNAKGVL